MGSIAAKKALLNAKISADQIDMILVPTLTPDYIVPSTACLIQAAIGAEKSASLDIQAACSGYLYALQLAKSLVEQKTYKNVLIVAAEKLSSIVNYKDRTTCILFGDGASACVVSLEGEGLEILQVALGSDGKQADLLKLPAGGCANRASFETVQKEMHFLTMSGSEVFKHAVRRMEEACKQCLQMANLSIEDIAWVIPHQANQRIIEAIARRFPNLDPERVMYKVLQKYGNTSASSIGISLDELLKEGKILPNENILLTAFGAGLTWGSAILKKFSE
jgi:3-oxoacyl-[acyl-carrier-protein] synthase III